jgi:hypothetical protein
MGCLHASISCLTVSVVPRFLKARFWKWEFCTHEHRNSTLHLESLCLHVLKTFSTPDGPESGLALSLITPTRELPQRVLPRNSTMQRAPTPPPAIPAPQLPASCEPPSPSRPPQQQVWVIFGATGHLGRSICRVALARGDCVTAVGRNIPAEEASMHGWHKRCQGLVCDVRDRKTVDAAWRAALEGWGRVDVVVKYLPSPPHCHRTPS